MIKYDIEALEYIGKLSEGGMRDAITLMDKCLAYSSELTLENVVKALGTVDYTTMIRLTDAFIQCEGNTHIIEIIEQVHESGKDIKQFIKMYTHFILDIQKYGIGCDWKYLNIPKIDEYEKWLSSRKPEFFEMCANLLGILITLNSDIKYSTTAKFDVEAALLMFFRGINRDWSE